MAVLQAKNLDEINSTHNLVLENGELLTVGIKATPMENLQMHSDILYSHGIVINEPNILMRKLAKSLKSKSKYLHDPNPNEDDWKGDIINKVLFKVQ